MVSVTRVGYSVSTEADTETFQDVYDAWYQPVRSFIARYGFEDELDDLTQEVFLKVWKARKKFKGQSELKTWIFKISLNLLRDRYRLRNLPWHKRWIPLAWIQDPTELPQHKYENKDLLQKALGELTPIYREILILFYLKELSSEDISKILNIPESTVRTRVHNGKKKLYAKLVSLEGINHE